MGEICVDISEGLDVGIAVEVLDGSDVVLVRGVAGSAGATIHVDDDLPLHFWVGGDGGGGVAPGGGGGTGVDVEREEDEDGGGGESEYEGCEE